MPMNTADPGWYRDPSDPDVARWWTGEAWSEQTRRIAITEAQAPLQPVSSSARTIPAGWYDDPSDPHNERWWDGRAWSLEHTRAKQHSTTEPSPSGSMQTPRGTRAEARRQAATAKGQRPAYGNKLWWAVGLVALVLVVVIVAVVLNVSNTSGTATASGTRPDSPSSSSQGPGDPGSSKASTVLLTQSATGEATTTTFTAPANWNLKWSYNCSSQPSSKGLFVVAVKQNPNSGTMAQLEDVPVDQGGTSGSGVQHYHYGGGGVYLTVDSTCSWTITAAGT
jgi:hypothetical protein